MSMGHEEHSQASSKSMYSHSSTISWNDFNPSFSSSIAATDDTTVTKEGWNSDPNCYSPQLGSYAQEAPLVNTSLSNTPLQAALWMKSASRKESRRWKWGNNLKRHAAVTPPHLHGTRGAGPGCQPLLQEGTDAVLGKHRTHLFRTGLRFCGSRLCSLLYGLFPMW